MQQALILLVEKPCFVPPAGIPQQQEQFVPLVLSTQVEQMLQVRAEICLWSFAGHLESLLVAQSHVTILPLHLATAQNSTLHVSCSNISSPVA